MEKVEIKVYKFSELSADVQEKVVDRERYNHLYHGWDTDRIEEKKTELEDFYFDEVEIQYGMGGQGSGASFTATVDFAKFLELHKDKEYPEGHILCDFDDVKWNWLARYTDDIEMNIIRHNNQYSHNKTVSPEWNTHFNNDDEELTETQENQLDSLVENIADFIKDEQERLSDDIYSALESAYDDEVSTSNISYLMGAHWFTADGEFFDETLLEDGKELPELEN